MLGDQLAGSAFRRRPIASRAFPLRLQLERTLSLIEFEKKSTATFGPAANGMKDVVRSQRSLADVASTAAKKWNAGAHESCSCIRPEGARS
jgi:hypothetical protein